MALESVPTEPQGNAKLQIDVEAEAGTDIPFTIVTSTRHADEGKRKASLDLEAARPEESGFTRPLVFAWIIAVLGSFQFGYGVGVTGPVKAKVVFEGHTKFQWSMMVSIFSLGGLIGAFLTGRLGANWPRKRVMLLGALMYTISGLVMGGSLNITMLTLGRFLNGIAGGSSTVIVPLFLKEIAPAPLRGTLGTGHQIAAVFGVFLTAILAFGFAGKSVSVTNPGWRFELGFTALTGLIQILLMPFVVESPTFLVSRNRIEDAGSVLARLRGTPQIASELKIIQLAIADRKDEGAMGFRAVLKDTSVRRQLKVGVLLHALMRLSGFNAVTFYANQILEQSGIEKPLVGTALVGFVNFASTVVALALIDRKGRRPLFIASTIGMICSSILLTLSLNDIMPMRNTVSVFSVMGFVAFFEIGLGPIPWTLVPEITPAKQRPGIVSMATVVNWTCLFIVGLVFPTMQSALKNFTFVPFAVCQFLALFVVLTRVPETKGKSVEEIATAMEEMKRK